MKIAIEKGIIVAEPRIAAGASGEGVTVLIIEGEGMKVRVALSPEESRTVGAGLIGCASIEEFLGAQKSAARAIVAPNGEPASPSIVNVKRVSS